MAGNWRGLSQLETELAKCDSTDLWYADAAQLRAEWRTKVRVQGENRFARDAISLVDRALLIDPSLDLYVLRATGAILLRDAHATIESVRAFGNHAKEMIDRLAKGEYHISSAGITALIERLNVFKTELDKPLYDKNGAAKEDVKRFLASLLHEVEAQRLQAH